MIATKLTNSYIKRLEKRKGRGLTLMEVAMVLAIIGIVIAAALLYFNTANTSQKIVSALGQVAQIQQSVRTLYSGQSDYTGLTTALIAGSEALPASMTDGTSITHPFNGAVTVVTNTLTPRNFTVTFAGFPSDACTQMLTKDLGRGLVSASSSAVPALVIQPNLPMDLGTATTACATAGNNNDIIWTFN